jgi:putative transposase
MPRKPRIHYPGALYHVMMRGNAGAPVFFDEADRCRFYLLVQEGTERFGFRVHAFCCMANHIHLALQVGEIPLSRIMQNLSLRYTAWINRRQGRSGHLFQGRYKALLIDGENYLLELVRYIHLNPVRAGVVDLPEDYPWSGHRGYLGREVLPWLTTDWSLSLFAPQVTKARQEYYRYIRDGLQGGHRQEFQSGNCEGRILGDDRFAEEALYMAREREHRPPQLHNVIEAVCRHYELTPEALRAPGKARPASEGRAWAAWLVRGMQHLTLAGLGEYLGRDVAALSQAARRLEVSLNSDPEVAKRGEVLTTLLEKV